MPTTGTMRYLKIGDATYEVYNTDNDTKVTQSYKTASEYTYWRPLVIGYSSGSAETFTPADQTNLTYTFNTLKVQPSTGTLRVGNLALYNGNYTTTFTPTTLTANRTITVPDKTGIIALTSDITSAIADLPEPMLFKGSVGTNGTITSLPTAAASNEGFTYKVITALSSPVSAKVGDTVISNGSEWVVIPSGDEPDGTVTSVGLSNATNGGLTISDSPVTSSGSITVGHSNVLTSAQTTQAVYPIKIDKNGHISAYGSALSTGTSSTSGITKLYGYEGTAVTATDGTYTCTAINTVANNLSLAAGDAFTQAQSAYNLAESKSAVSVSQVISTGTNIADITIDGTTTHLYSPSGGTVTSVGISNGGGLSVSGSPVTSSGTITVSHADTSSQSSSSNSGRTYIQSVTLDTYGHVTGLSTATETVTNTDEKLKVAEVTSATQYYPLVGTGTTAVTRQYDTTGLKYKGTTGTTSAVGSSILELGNSTTSGTAGNKQGQIILYGTNSKKATITLEAPSADVALALPTSGGTLALTSQLPSVPTTAASNTTGITASTTATKTTLGTAFTIPNVTSAGSASTWVFEDISCDDITSWSAGSGSASLSGAVNSSDSTQLDITLSHTHTASSLSYTARTVSSKKSGANGSAPTLGTSFTVPNVTGNTSATVSITDNGHTHSLS